jgi:CRISPR-associated endonuclease/helicase Cas3
MADAHPDFVARYWGKAQPKEEDAPRWHPLAFHALDVAACASALLENQPSLLRALARVSGLSEAHARMWTLCAVALHDLGKFTPAFQVKSDEIEALADPAIKWKRPQAEDPGHAHTGGAFWDIALKDEVFTKAMADLDAPYAFRSFYLAACGHHGRPAKREFEGADAFWRTFDRGAEDRDAPQKDALDFARATIGLLARDGLAGSPHEQNTQRASWLVAGITNLCDWAGSDQAFFPYRQAGEFPSLDAYWEMTQDQAKEALREKGLMASEVSPSLILQDLLSLPDEVTVRATPLQRWAQSSVLGPFLSGDRPVFAVIEDFTGSGKTEAAALLAHRIMAVGGARGLYWALPTQATSNAIHARFEKVFRKFYVDDADPSIVNAHGAAKLAHALTARERANPKTAAAKAYGGEGHDPAEADATRWLHDDKRTALFADIGVGTIDQALLAVLPSKFNVLRLLGLSKGVLVIDEAHSYDPYMNALMERLVTFQAALGGSVVILSATLTTAQRLALTAAFARGVGASLDRPVDLGMHFPSAVLAVPDDAGGLRVHADPLKASPEEMRGTRRDLAVDRLDCPNTAEAYLLERAAEGECAVYIRNTVGDAIESFERLCKADPERAEAGKITLFHARFSMMDRARIEDATLRAFGKDSKIEGREGRILVSTQVVEQSLDLDFDNMITDLAPIDLMIQRAGRLHRHADHAEPYRRKNRPAPRLLVVAPLPAAKAGANWYSSVFPVANYVYPNTGRLWAGLHEVETRGGLNLLHENPRELLDAVYTLDDAAMPEALGEITRRQEEGIDRAQRGQGIANALEPDRGYGPEQAAHWEAEARTPTRLGEMGEPVRLAVMDQAGRLVPFGWEPEEGRRWPDWLDWVRAEIRLRRSQFVGFLPSSPEESRLSHELLNQWQAARDNTPLVVLRTCHANPSWNAAVRIERAFVETSATACYDSAVGWRLTPRLSA